MTEPHEDETFDDLTSRLSGLAADASAYTTASGEPMSAESVRRLGGRRRHRRIGGVVAAALAIVVMAGGAAVGANRLAGDTLPGPVASPESAVPASPTGTASSSSTPSPSSTPGPSSTPAPSTPADPTPTSGGVPTGSSGQGVLDPALLPQPTDLAWFDQGDYRTESTSQGLGALPPEACVASLPGLDPVAVGRRDFTGVHDATTLDVQATTWVLRFDGTDAADAALATLQATGQDCGPGSEFTVPVERGSAEFYEHATPTGFLYYGVGRVGETIAVVLMSSLGEDSIWSYDVKDTTGVALHPMIRSLPLVDARLAGTPGQVATSNPPAEICPGGQDGLLVSVSPVKGADAPASYRITVTNTSKVACVMHGYPGVQFGDDQGDQVGAAATRTGDSGSTIALQPGNSSIAIITMTAADSLGEDCEVSTVSTFRIFLPGASEPSFTYSPGMQACTNAKIEQLEVTAFGTP